MKHIIYLDYDYKTNFSEKIIYILKYKFDGVFVFHRKDMDKAFEELKKTDLFVEAIHLSYKYCNELWVEGILGDDYVRRTIEGIHDAKKYNVKTVVFHVSSSENPPKLSEIGIERLKQILKVCEENQINLACENLRRPDYIDYIFETLNSEYLKFCFDSGHANAFTKNIDSFPFEKYQDRLICLHLHDNDAVNDLHQIPTEGTIDWKKLMKNLKKFNYQGPLTSEAVFYKSEDVNEEDFVKKVKESLIKLESYFLEE